MRTPVHRVRRAVSSTQTKATIVVLADGGREIPIVLPYEELEKFIKIKEFIDSGAYAGLSHGVIEFSDLCW